MTAGELRALLRTMDLDHMTALAETMAVLAEVLTDAERRDEERALEAVQAEAARFDRAVQAVEEAK